jgi:tetratricopeptide (TPR) repeat protein
MTKAPRPPVRAAGRAGGTAKEIARLLAEGVRLHRRGDLRRADACYRRVLRLDPGQADALHLAGLIAHQTGDQSEALALIEQALAIDSRQAPFHNSQGVVLLALDRLTEAEAAFKRALDRDPLYAEALNNLGNALQRQERNGEAVAAYDRAVDVLPAYAEAWCNRGRALHLDGRPGDAMASLREALELRPGWTKALRWLGDAAATAGDLSEAEAHYRRAAAFDSADAEAWASLAALLERGSRLEEALAAACAALAADPSLLRAAVTAARVLRRQGRPEQALARLRESETLAAPAEERAAAAFERGQILDRLGDYRQAYAAFVEGNRLLADTPAAHRIDRGIFPDMIARLRASFTAEWVAGWTPASGGDVPAPIFLVGFPRSGTTLLDQILDSHPALTTMEEKDALDQVRRAVQQMPGGYPEALAGMSAATLADLRALYRTEVRRHVGDLGGRILVDKMPLNTIDVGLIHRLFPSARILLALRHPRDVVLSGFMQAMQPNAAMVLFDSIPSTARFYAQVMELWQQYLSVLPVSVVSIRYEDLVADLAGETRRILGALGLPWDDAVLGYAEHAKSRAISTPSYHQVVQPIYRRSVDRWRNYAFAFDEALPALRPFIERFGYAAPEPPAA